MQKKNRELLVPAVVFFPSNVVGWKISAAWSTVASSPGTRHVRSSVHPGGLVLSRLIGTFLAAWLALVSPPDSGLHYRAQVNLVARFSLDVRVEGDLARLDIQSSDDPNLAAGTTLLTSDRGETFLVVNPALQEYFSLPRSVITNFKQQQAVRLHVTADQISSEKVGEDRGPEIAGYPTRHLRFHLHLATHQARAAGELTTSIDVFEHFWLAEQLSQRNTDLAMLSDSSATGIPSLDEFLRAQILESPGFILRRSLVLTTDDSLQNHRVERSSYEVSDLSVADSPPDLFKVSEGFHQRVPQGAPSAAPPPAPAERPQ
jgi:hypothetical protein